ncbi:gliding motility-associated C-terminal domain-containing protein [Chitinophaga oryzae]|uniref:Gliding motility-associated C-terminal domain-containing protein n=1 Tax=Chitinophaga oryzae TaxID=2725414 RepID=A0ABX6LB22_9BACT|nr:gliding motility-associated C-terminal domain-containing protein [Chitinophaga oryzae]QJB37162.1 gliding motility-associated C-terminal domain-containing protein [Chitinophaga oryzae]
MSVQFRQVIICLFLLFPHLVKADTFVVTSSLKAAVLKVYSRWGQVVFTTQDLQRGWDGTRQNVPLPAGDYVWMLKAVDIAGQEVQKSGSILLIR